MFRPTRARARLIGVAVAVAAVAASSAVIWQASYSAFSSTTASNSNWTAGTVALTNDHSGSAVFDVKALKPGATGNNCILVTSAGTLASAVKIYATKPETTNALSGSITLAITEGAPKSDCAKFAAGATLFNGKLLDFGTAATDYSKGLGTWAPAGTAPETRAYQFVYTMATDAPNTVQGGTAGVTFTWESQNTA